jgi:hypothetical protein
MHELYLKCERDGIQLKPTSSLTKNYIKKSQEEPPKRSLEKARTDMGQILDETLHCHTTVVDSE